MERRLAARWRPPRRALRAPLTPPRRHRSLEGKAGTVPGAAAFALAKELSTGRPQWLAQKPRESGAYRCNAEQRASSSVMA